MSSHSHDLYQLVELLSLNLHAKFQNHWPSGSGEEDFLKVFALYSHGGHLGHVTWTIYVNFCSPLLRSLALIGQAVSKKIFEIVDEDGRMPEHGHPISSPLAQVS